MNHDEEAKNMSVFDVFSQGQLTLDEAKKKNQEESSTKAQYLRLSKDGIYNVRVLPLAPVIDADGNPLPMERKGYEYPSKEYLCKIKTGKVDKKNKEVFQYVNVCNAKLAYPKLPNDLIDLYVDTVCAKYADDAKLCETIRSSSFNGGLKYDKKRCMYVLDMDKRGSGMQILQLSFAQYKELENRKLKLWSKLSKKGSVPCPISSPMNAYPIEIERKNENGKTSYEYNIDQASGIDELSETELQALLDAPRLPDVLYKYTRYHLEATIVFLNQMDERFGIKVMKEEVIKDCIDQIKMALPSDDQSHFTLKEGDKKGTGAATLDDLFAILDSLDAAGKTDRSEEGADLRGQIREFIDTNNLSVKVSRSKSNLDLLNEIQDLMADESGEPELDEEEDDESPKSQRSSSASVDDEEEEDEDDDSAPSTPYDEDEDEEEEDENPRRSRNDDTNEPAARPARRVARPARRR